MKLVLLVVSVIAVFTADSRDIAVKPEHDLPSPDEGDLTTPDDPSSTNEDELFPDGFNFTGIHPPFPEELNHGSVLITDEPQDFNFTGVHPPFPEEGEGPHEEKNRANYCFDEYIEYCPKWAFSGYCIHTYQEFMAKWCRKSCNQCSGDCTDKYPTHCPSWSADGKCSGGFFKQWILTNCPKSCNQCVAK